MLDALQYTSEMIKFESTSCLSNVAVTDYGEDALRSLGFTTERVDYVDRNGIAKSNVIGKKGEGTGGVAYFGHTDVVPAADWACDHGAYEPTQRDGRLYGRGSCDMKGSIACMLDAAQRFEATKLKHPIYITMTADEEVGYVGATHVVEHSKLYQDMLHGDAHGIIGEPTNLGVVYAHKGTYGFRAISKGRAAHSSTSEGLNANLAMIPFLVEMKAIHDQTLEDPYWLNPEFDPPTISWNIGINDHNHAINITAPQSVCTVYFRPSPGQDPKSLIDRVRRKADECGIEFEVLANGDPLYIDPKSAYIQAVKDLAGGEPKTVCYGTDGSRFRAMKNLVVLGPGDIAQAHTADEWIDLDQLTAGTDLYERMIQRWCCES